MVKKIPVPDSTAEALRERMRSGETNKDVIERLLDNTPAEAAPDTEQLAQNAMNISELEAAHSENMGNAEYLAHAYDVDASEYESTDELRKAKQEASR